MITLIDDHIVEGAHIGVAVDISSSAHVETFVSVLLKTLSRSDVLTVVVFGTHTAKQTFKGNDPTLAARVHSMMTYVESGTNVHVGLNELEGSVRFLLSDGFVNEGPTKITSEVPIHCVSPLPSRVMEDIAKNSGGEYCVFPCSVERCAIRDKMLSLLGKQPPAYFNLKLRGPFRTYNAPSLARGGQMSVLMLTPEDGVAALTYVDESGVEFEELCPFENSGSFSKIASRFLSPVSRSCDMREF
jgi:hypothetical protein